MKGEKLDTIKNLIRTIPDYPKKGIMFRDITTLLADATGFKKTISGLCEPYVADTVDAVVAIEARGFILGGAVADRLGCSFIPLRKKGKLPYKTFKQEYVLEYNSDTIEIHADAIKQDARIIIIDDLIATGGTAEAAVKLIKLIGGEIIGAAFVIDLAEMGGRQKLESIGVGCNVLVTY
ncbi:MAG: Adenine phosphoribosyltransferase [Hyphomicrobiaceae bacterium hypho_1]